GVVDMARAIRRGLIPAVAVLTGVLAIGGAAEAGPASIAVDDVATTRPGAPVVIDVLANDRDPSGDPLRLVGVGTAAGGTAVVSNDKVVYEPATSSPAVDYFSYARPLRTSAPDRSRFKCFHAVRCCPSSA